MAKVKEEVSIQTEKRCGIVMPIAGFDGYSAAHWVDVKKIISEAAKAVDFEPNLVSYTDETSVIHATIINNLYANEIVVVDVSGKNPNVMFELGIRLAFDKPTIIIKDDKTNYIFDTGVIDHLVYPEELDYYSIIDFKEKLSSKIEITYKKSKEIGYRSFLKNFSDVALSSKLERIEVSESEFIIREIQELRKDISTLKISSNKSPDSIKSSVPIDVLSLRAAWKNYLIENGLDPNISLDSKNAMKFYNSLKDGPMKKFVGTTDFTKLISMVNSD